ncbi:MAG: PKD domain-containing protein [Ruminococcus sp.]|nr:PKD domain-containing protein [Ruminococcus sp.]
MKKIISILLCAVMMMSVCVFNTSAAMEPMYYGDANADGDENIIDVTFIQRCLAQIDVMDKLQFELSDVDDDGDISVIDATIIQQYLAGLIDGYKAGGGISIDMSIREFYSNYGDAVVSSQEIVTFYANVDVDDGVSVECSFYVNGELVKKSEDPGFAYCFEEAGEYKVKLVAQSNLGVVEEAYLYVTSIGDELRTKPEIGVYYTNLRNYWELSSADRTALMNVVVIGNTGECEYGFEIYDGETLVASQEMSTDNTFLMNPHKLLKGYRYSEYTTRVIVNTGDGNVYFRNVPVTIVPVRI